MRRGVTLIELSISICILIIIFSVSSLGYESYRKYKNNIEKVHVLYEVEDFLNFSKCYSSRNKVTATISKEKKLNCNSWILTFSNAGETIKTINLGDAYKEIIFEKKNNASTLKVEGGMIESVKIVFKVENGEDSNITIDVFPNVIRIKDEYLKYNWQRGRGD